MGSNYQANLGLVVGINGDVWLNNVVKLDDHSVLAPRLQSLTFGQFRGSYQFINNLPPISKIVGYDQFNITLLARNGTLIRLAYILSPEYQLTIDNVSDAWEIDNGQVVYLHNHNLRITGSIDILTSRTISTGVNWVYPMKLTSAGNGRLYDSLLVGGTKGCEVIYNPQEGEWQDMDKLITWKLEIHTDEVVAVSREAIYSNNSIMQLSISDDHHLNSTTRPISLRGVRDILHLNGEYFYLVDDKIYDDQARPIVSGISRLLHTYLSTHYTSYLIGQDQRAYELTNNNGYKLADTGIDIVLR